MFISISSVSVFAGHPLLTDDATIVEDKACQLESWMERRSKSITFWMLPACNFTGNLELTVGGGWTHEANRPTNSLAALQGKSILKPLESNGWGLGVAAGTLWHREGYSSYAYLPASFSFKDDRIIVNGNLGWTRNAARVSHLDWGISAQAEVTRPLFLFAEVFGQERGHPAFQYGFWYWIVSERVQVNATYGNRFGTPPGGYWFTVGFSLFSGPVLP